MTSNGQDNSSKKENTAEGKPVRLAHRYTRSKNFRDLFSHGMDLVEETANFLDNDGRELTRDLAEDAKALYGTESMKLTTRLMQIASWLLLQRAVAEGEMTEEQAKTETQHVRLNRQHEGTDSPLWQKMPKDFIDLVDRSLNLQHRIMLLDREIYPEESEQLVKDADNPVAVQRALLETAFDPRFNRKSA